LSISVFVPIAGLILALFAFCSLSYMRAVNALSTYLKRERPEVWRAVLQWPLTKPYFLYSNSDAVTEERGVSNLVLGIHRPDLHDTSYKRFLRTARGWLIACLLLFTSGLVVLTWFFRNLH
jgi:hypothetical protein